MSEKTLFGINGLDELFGKALTPPSLVVIAGHPGSGKTTLALSMTYANAVEGKKCLYITLQEGKEKILKVTRKMGMDLDPLIRKGYIKLAELPVITTITDATDTITRLLTENKYNLVIIDSINILLEPVNDEEMRAWLQNFFYRLAHYMKGTVILLAEMPYGSETLEMGSLEFVADVLVILKYKYEYGLLLREMEIRKARGIPVRIGRIPFMISDKGIRVFPPIKMDKLTIPHRRAYKISYEPFRNYLENILAGETMFIAYPPDARSAYTILLPLDIIISNNLKALLISYKYSPTEAREIVVKSLSKIGFPKETIDDIVKNIIFHAFNPTGMSIAELTAEELMYLEEIRPDMVVYHGEELVVAGKPQNERAHYFNSVVNQLAHNKSNGLITIRFASIIDEEFYKINSALSDIVLRIDYEIRFQQHITPRIYMWKRGRMPIMLEYEEIIEKQRLEKWKKLVIDIISKR